MTTTESKDTKILVADDEDGLRALLHYVLRSAGYDVRLAENGQQALQEFFAWKPDLVVVDIMMPKMNGWDLLDRIREVSNTPIVILSALGEETDTVKGLEGGAEDYVIKPPRPREFLARVQAALRKGEKREEPDDIYQDSVIYMDFPRHLVYREGQRVELSPLEFRILATLVQQPGVVLSAERLLDSCWRDGTGGLENVRVYIGYLRRKIEKDPRNPKLIETVREFGYRYRPPAKSPEVAA